MNKRDMYINLFATDRKSNIDLDAKISFTRMLDLLRWALEYREEDSVDSVDDIISYLQDTI